MYFCAFNFCTSQAVRKYFNNEIFAIYGTCTTYMYMCTVRPLYYMCMSILCMHNRAKCDMGREKVVGEEMRRGERELERERDGEREGGGERVRVGVVGE